MIDSTLYVLAYSLNLSRLILVLRFEPRSNRSVLATLACHGTL